MTKLTIIDNEFASLWYYPEKKIVHHKFKKFIFGQAFRDVLTTGLELFRENGCQKWLSDDRGNPVLNQTDKAWGDVNWTPHVIAAGWKYWALVMPEQVLGQMSMNRLVDEFRGFGVEVYVCDDPDKGLKWLESQGETPQ